LGLGARDVDRKDAAFVGALGAEDLLDLRGLTTSAAIRFDAASSLIIGTPLRTPESL